VGQKVHPLGFRLVTTQKHRSIWFAEFENYSELLKEDTLIREILAKKSKETGISKSLFVPLREKMKMKLTS
jgi:small subunit ribosomal protein S3